MPLPSSGNSISLNQVNVELGFSGTAQISLDDLLVRALFRVSAGQISMSDGYGKTASLDLGFTKNLVIFTADGTAGASNSSFVDSSSNALALTVTSSSPTTHAKIAPGQGAFSPFLPTSYWSAAVNIDRSQAYRAGIKLDLQLTIADSADSCIEWWWNPLNATTPTTATAFVIFDNDSSSGADRYACTISASSGTVTLIWKSITVLTVTGLANVISGKWTHYAVIKSGSNLYLFIDGQKVGTSSTLNTDGAFNLVIQRILGLNPGLSGLDTHFTPGGYFSNFRIVSGSIVYTNAISTNSFVVPYTPLTAIPGTKLLLFNSSSIKDNSPDARALTVANNFISVISFSPFSNKTPYVAATHGGSASFLKDNAFSFIRTQSNSVFGFGTQNFTLEAWVYPDSTPLAVGETERAMRVFWFSDDTGGLEVVWVPGSSVYGALRYFGATPSDIVYGGSTAKVIAGQWNHIAVCRNYSDFKIYAYVNGQYLGNANLGSQISYGSRSCYIGARDTPYSQTKNFYGYISNARISNTLRYTGTTTYTVPTGPFTNDANTVFLCKMENAALNDLMSGTCGATNEVSLATAVKKFGSASLSLQGSAERRGLYLKPMVRPAVPDGSTYEMWYYATNSVTGTLLEIPGEGYYTPAGNTTLNTWRHFALCTLLSKLSVYHDGVLAGESRAANIGDTLSGISVGNHLQGNTQNGIGPFLGYIDSVRVTQYPRYVGTNTSGFTVPTEAAETVSERIINVNSIIGIGGSKVFDLDGYRYHVYTSSANFYCLKSGTVHAFLVGGGGSGAPNGTISVPGGGTATWGGGGGAGGSITNNTSVSVTAGTSYSIVIGAGGYDPFPYPAAGGTTTAFGLSASGGAAGTGVGAGGAMVGNNGGPGAEYAPLRLKFSAGGGRGLATGAGSGGDCGYLSGQFIGGGHGGHPSYETGDDPPETVDGLLAEAGWMYGSGGGGFGVAANSYGRGAGGIVIVRYAL